MNIVQYQAHFKIVCWMQRKEKEKRGEKLDFCFYLVAIVWWYLYHLNPHIVMKLLNSMRPDNPIF